MRNICRSVDELIGHTPLLELTNTEKNENLQACVLAKLEGMNPAGSAKDRVALAVINDAQARGVLTAGGTIIEPTSGNTGIGLACIAAARGYQAIIVMPDSMSPERIKLMRSYGAQVVLTPGELGMNGAIAKAEALQKELPGSFIAGQFENPANAQAHFDTTGPEIWADTQGNVDIFVAGIGTGGTITGTGRFLKAQNPAISIVGVEPAGSPILSCGVAGKHGLQGIGAGFVPKVLDTGIYDQIIPITEAQAYAAARNLGKTEGVLVGISSGAALHAALELAKQPENAGKTIVVLLPDTGDRYLSTDLFGN